MALIYLGYKALTGKKKGEKDEDGEATPDIRDDITKDPSEKKKKVRKIRSRDYKFSFKLKRNIPKKSC